MKQVEKYISRDGKKGRLTSRILVPAELQLQFGRRELPKALGTADLAEGRRLHAIRYGEVLKAFEEARQKLAAQRAELVARASASLTRISPEQADALGKHYVHPIAPEGVRLDALTTARARSVWVPGARTQWPH